MYPVIDIIRCNHMVKFMDLYGEHRATLARTDQALNRAMNTYKGNSVHHDLSLSPVGDQEILFLLVE